MHINVNDLSGEEISPGVVERVLMTNKESKPGGLGAKHYTLTEGGEVVFKDPLTEYQHFIIQGVGAMDGQNGDLIHADTAWFVPCPKSLKANEKPLAKHSIAHTGEGEVKILSLSYKISEPKLKWVEGKTKNLFQVPQYHSSSQIVGFTQIFSSEELSSLGAEKVNGVIIQTNTAGIALNNKKGPEEVIYVLRGWGKGVANDKKYDISPGSFLYSQEEGIRGIKNTHTRYPLQYLLVQFN
jgi:hypothetical protein